MTEIQLDLEKEIAKIIAKQRAMARAFKGGTLTRKQRAAALVRSMRRGRA